MQVAVWDTYVTRKDGKVMHFDIIVPDDLEDENKIKTIARNTTGDLRRVSTSIIALRIDEKRQMLGS